MSVKKDASGRRSIQVEVEVPGTPEEVWQAIATGPGVSSWFVQTESEEREGGTVTSHFGPGMDSVAKVTAWDPPRRFAAESDGLAPGAPPLATEWTVEAKAGGTCLVRVVHSMFASTDDWDNQLESVESGWPAFFRILRLYLTRFRGQQCKIFQSAAIAAAPVPQAWASLTDALGIGGVAVGQPCKTGDGAPQLAGTVEAVGERERSLLVRFEGSAPGVVSMNACGMGPQTYLVLSFYLYGENAAAAAARDEPVWSAWMSETFPAEATATGQS